MKHHRTAPYHPASNGAAENAMRSFKDKFKVMLKENASRHDALYKFVFQYRSTPHCTTGYSPAELQMGRKLRTRLSAVTMSARENVESCQACQRYYFKGSRQATFAENVRLMAKDYATDRWRPAKVLEKLGPMTYSVLRDDNRVGKGHVVQLRPCEVRNYESREIDVSDKVMRYVGSEPLVSREAHENTNVRAVDKSAEQFCESPSVNKSIVTSPIESSVMFKDKVVQEAKPNENALDIVPLQCP